MLNQRDFTLLFDAVGLEEIQRNHVSSENIKYAKQNLTKAYQLNLNYWTKETPRCVDYNDVAHKYVYLQKLAPLHASIVQDMIYRALAEGAGIFRQTILDYVSHLKICSLGGGPGSDVFGVLSAMYKEFGLRHCSAKIVDSMCGWRSTFDSALKKLRSGGGRFSNSLTSSYFQYSFIESNLLKKMSKSVRKAIRSSNLITMVKFVSATTCKDTEPMVKEIFNLMSQGSFLLFIDNATGGFCELVARLADDCGLLPVFGPLERLHYSKKGFGGNKRHFSIPITVHLLMKPYTLTTQRSLLNSVPNILIKGRSQSLSKNCVQHYTCNEKGYYFNDEFHIHEKYDINKENYHHINREYYLQNKYYGYGKEDYYLNSRYNYRDNEENGFDDKDYNYYTIKNGRDVVSRINDRYDYYRVYNCFNNEDYKCNYDEYSDGYYYSEIKYDHWVEDTFDLSVGGVQCNSQFREPLVTIF